MAAPTAPTLATIVSEGLQKAGYGNPTSALTSRAQDYWMEEIKNDIWQLGKRLKSLQVTAAGVLINGQSKYAFPSDFSSPISVQLMYGTHTGTAQAGASGSVTLASTEDISETDILGKEILITSGTGINSLSQCIGYNTSTKVASVTPAWATNPTSGSGYMIIDTYYPLTQAHVMHYDTLATPTTQSIPTHYYPTGDSDSGEYLLYPVPYVASGVLGVKIRYYADLTLLDLASTTMSTLYRRWRNVFIQGIYARGLMNNDDAGAEVQMSNYYNLMKLMISQETYGSDLSNITMQVVDY